MKVTRGCPRSRCGSGPHRGTPLMPMKAPKMPARKLEPLADPARRSRFSRRHARVGPIAPRSLYRPLPRSPIPCSGSNSTQGDERFVDRTCPDDSEAGDGQFRLRSGFAVKTRGARAIRALSACLQTPRVIRAFQAEHPDVRYGRGRSMEAERPRLYPAGPGRPRRSPVRHEIVDRNMLSSA